MFELVKSGGLMMIPIILCSIVALAVFVERVWTLQRSRVAPKHMVAQIYHLYKRRQLDNNAMAALRNSSYLGQILAAGVANVNKQREVMKESIEETGRHVVHEMEKYLNMLGTIASISPLLGLLGTVIGMIKVFTVITAQGVGNPSVLAGGISEALITTAAGLTVAIPSLMGYRFLRRHIDDLVVMMEQEAIKLVEIIHGQRSSENLEEKPA
ncbi:MAG: MotA/TolQ/ExbB proton channel family protein [Gammaproteobacteria bacterium]|nr:MotA/TolQ/ExbB proton channel family protein [Gammaproteobacteria bacterium]